MAKLTLEQLKVKMERWTREMPRALLKALKKGGSIVVADIQANRLRGQVLNVRTGTLIGSITSKQSATPRGAMLQVGTNVWYGRMWELGEGVPERPFIRPSIKAKQPRVMQIILDEMMRSYG